MFCSTRIEKTKNFPRKISHLTVLAGCLVLLLTTTVRAEYWVTRFHALGIDGEVGANALLNNDLIVGGRIVSAGPYLVQNVARWDGEHWYPLGPGLDGPVSDLVTWGADIVACGEFTHAGNLAVNHVARWDGVQWHALGAGLPGAQMALAVFENELWCGGWRFDGLGWTDVLQTDDVVRDLIEFQDRLIAGGDFLTAGGLAAEHVLAWDGGPVVALPGQALAVADLEVVADQLYALPVDDYWFAVGVQTWDGAAWVDVGEPELEFEVALVNLLNDDGQLKLLKNVANFFFGPSPEIGTWNGAAWEWQPVTSSDAEASTLFPYGDDLVISGRFAVLDGTAAHQIALLTDTGVLAMGSAGDGIGNHGYIGDMCSTPEGVAIGGYVSAVGPLVTSGAALWDGVQWQSRSGGAYIVELVWHAGQLHAFYFAGDVVAANHAIWIGDQWVTDFAWPSQADLPNDAISYDSLLIAAGFGLADWSDPTTPVVFAEMPGGDKALCLTEWQGRLAVGGEFSGVEGLLADNVAIYEDGVWSEPGGGVDGTVKALVEHAGGLVAAGTFDLAGSVAARNIALFDGEQWQALGDGLDGEVLALASYEGVLYAGGTFATVGDGPGGHLARWINGSWEAVGGGVGNRVTELIVSGDKLHIGGRFGRVGNVPAVNFAIWNGDPVGDVPRSLSDMVQLRPAAPNPFNPLTTISYALGVEARVELAVYDLRGHLVAVLVDGERASGEHQVTWDGVDQAGRGVAAGSYLLRLQAAGQERRAKVLLVE